MNGADTDDRPGSIDSAFYLLSDEHRRTLCRYVTTTEKSVFSTAELVERLLDGRSRGDRGRLRVDLTHVHLPMLAEHGIIEYDRRQGTVRVDDERFAAFCGDLEAAIADTGCVEVD